jgi:hypothetical protein
MNRPLIAVLLLLAAFWLAMAASFVAGFVAGAAAVQRSGPNGSPAVSLRQVDDGLLVPSPVHSARTSGPDRYPDRSVAAAPPFVAATALMSSASPWVPRDLPASEAAVPPGAQLPVTASMGGTIAGIATWFASPQNVSAAGPALRRALGPGWRGSHVRVCSGGRCAVTTLGDACWCPDRRGVPVVIDLDDDVFARLAPLSRGVIAVTIGAVPAPPATTTLP